MRGKVECVVSTERADRETWPRFPEVPFAVVRYETDDRSIERLRSEIQRLGQAVERVGAADESLTRPQSSPRALATALLTWRNLLDSVPATHYSVLDSIRLLA